MLTYSDAMKMYNEESENNDNLSSITLEGIAQYDCELNIMGRILYAIRAGHTHACYVYGRERFNDKDYCRFYKEAVQKYLFKYGYKNVCISFEHFPNARYTSCKIKIYF